MSRVSEAAGATRASAPQAFHSLETQGLPVVPAQAIVTADVDVGDLPTDPLFGEQENLFNPSAEDSDRAADINIAPVWALGYTGAKISIGVYDTAMDVTHVDLVSNIDMSKRVGGPKGVDPTVISDTGDEHATSVAGVIAAARNGVGVVGIAYDAILTPINIFKDNTYTWDAMKQQTLFQVTNHSWSFVGAYIVNPLSTSSAYALSGFTLGADRGRGGLGTIEVVAAGNYRHYNLSTETNGLTVDRHILVVGATDSFGDVSYYSNPGASLLVVAPSSDYYTGVTTTDVTGSLGYTAGDYTSNFGGTSAATPQISGIAANILQANSGLGWRDVQKILSVSATHTGTEIGGGFSGYEKSAWMVNASQTWNGGGMHYSNDYGFGMADAYAAVLIAEDWFKAFSTAGSSKTEQKISASATGQWDVGRGNVTTITVNIAADQTIEAMVLDLNDLLFGVGKNLTVELVSPSGTISRLLDGYGLSESSIVGGWQMLSRAFMGENARGTWTIRITSDDQYDFGMLSKVTLSAYGSGATDASVLFYTDEYSELWTPERSVVDNSGTALTLFASAVTGSILLDLRAGTGTINGSAVTIADGTYVRTVITSDSDSEIVAGDQGVRLFGGRGDDLFYAGAGQDAFDGGAGFDTVSYRDATGGVVVSLSPATSKQKAGTGVDTFTGIEQIVGSIFSDTLTGGLSNDVLDGADGDDTMTGGAGADRLIGGLGNDTVTYATSRIAVSIDLGANIAIGGEATGDTFYSIESIIGSLVADTITGDGNDNTLDGGLGDDTLSGGDGDDTLIGGAGADILIGGAGSDTVSYISSRQGVTVDLGFGIATGGDAQGDTLTGIENATGTNANDVLIGMDAGSRLSGRGGNDLLVSGAGADWLDGGDGVDTASYAAASAALTIDLRTGSSSDGDTLVGIENVIGGNGNDRLSGNEAANRIDGGAGDDIIDGGAGNDVLLGGSGNDTVSYESAMAAVIVSLALVKLQQTGGGGADTISGFENLIGAAFADTLTGDAFSNVLKGADGDDTLIGGAGGDVLDGGAGFDTVSYAASRIGVSIDLMSGTGLGGDAEGDTFIDIENVTGSAGADVIIGSAIANTLNGGLGDDSLAGGDGDDILIGGMGADRLSGGAGIDTVSYITSKAGVVIDLSTGIGLGGEAIGDTFIDIENVTGTNVNDTLIGSAQDNVLSGLAGNDILVGGHGADVLDGGLGIDTASYAGTGDAVIVDLSTGLIAGAASGDVLISIENLTGGSGWDILSGDAGNNRIDGGMGDDLIEGGAGDDVLIGGDGFDTVSYARAWSGVTVSLATPRPQQTGGNGTDTLTGFEAVIGSNFGDSLTGDSRANALYGLDGDDTLIGGAGGDLLHGGAGSDTVSYATAKLAVSVDLGAGTASGGDAEGDILIDIENVIGSSKADTLTGNADGNALSGGLGNDILDGAMGDDRLDGGIGNDRLTGGAGFDLLTGGAGADAFCFADAAGSADTITDFSATDRDVIRICKSGFGIDENVRIGAGGAFDFADYLVNGLSATTADHGQFLFDASATGLWWDADGSGGASAVLIATLQNVLALSATQFDLY